jgi:predicted permease
MRQLRFALRTLFKTPFVTSVAALSLGLGIGANTAMFSIFNQVLLRPLPVPAPQELVNLGAPGPKNGSTSCNQAGDCDQVFAYPMFRDLEREQKAFTGIAAHNGLGTYIGYQNITLPEDGEEVSGSYFGVLGLKPAFGRLIDDRDDLPAGGADVAVVSYEYWQSRFESNPAILGASIVVNGHPMAVIGVAPRGFEGTTRGRRPVVYVPFTLHQIADAKVFSNRSDYWLYLFARRLPGITIDQARAAINVPYARIISDVDAPAQKGLTDQRLEQFKAKRVTVVDGRQGQSSVMTSARVPMIILMTVTGVVLLIACANVANLLLARAAGRAGEMAVRLSIGAGRAQLIRQLLLESCVLAALGGLTGLLFMRGTHELVVSQLPSFMTGSARPEWSWSVLAFTAALSLATGLLFGLFPALHSTRPDLATTLKNQSGQPSGAKGAARFRAVLVTVQIALSMGMLACAGLFTKSLLNVTRVDLGVKIDHLITFGLNPRRNGYKPAASRELFERVEERLRAVPGVTGVSEARVPLIANSSSSTSITVEGFVPEPGSTPSPKYNEIGPDFFRTIGSPLIAGRDFTPADAAGAPKVIIVNEAFARKYNIGPNPIGHRIRRGGKDGDPFDMEIVGLAHDFKYSEVRADMPPVFFVPYRQNEQIGNISFYVRTALDEETLTAKIRPLVAELDGNLPVTGLRTMTQQIENNTSEDRMASVLSGTFAGLATLLASIGLYGVLSFTVSQRIREFGLRLALGATPSAVRGLVLRSVLWMTLVGGAIGLGAAVYVARLAASMLFKMKSYDPGVLASAATILTVVALGAGFVPALRASRVDPMKALRQD